MIEWSEGDRLAMRRALFLAGKGLYSSFENPRVGACFVKDNEVIAEGFHSSPGFPHAEIEAMGQTDPRFFKGSTCLVTLEPCSHVGRTAPCADALIEAGVSRVVIAMEDPNPLVSGQGIQRLRAAGIRVDVGLYRDDAKQLNPGFIKRMTKGSPWIWIKSAASLDGKIAMADGRSKWITGTEARLDVQRLRARCQAIMTGINTVLMDDPRLTVRHEEVGIFPPHAVPGRQPLRVIVDTTGRLPHDAKLIAVDGPILWVTAFEVQHPALKSGRLQHWLAPQIGGRVDLVALMIELARRSINEVMVEAGPTLSGSLISCGLIDAGVLYLAPKLLGRAALSLYDLSPAQLTDAPEIFIQKVQSVGQDLRLDWTLRTRT